MREGEALGQVATVVAIVGVAGVVGMRAGVGVRTVVPSAGGVAVRVGLVLAVRVRTAGLLVVLTLSAAWVECCARRVEMSRGVGWAMFVGRT